DAGQIRVRRVHPDRGDVGAEQIAGGRPQVVGGSLVGYADEVRAEQPRQQRVPVGQAQEQLDGRKETVQLDAGGQVGPAAAQQFGQQLEVVVMDPYRGARAGQGVHLGRVASVDLLVRLAPLATDQGLVDAVIHR